jgi:hypothetical protein
LGPLSRAGVAFSPGAGTRRLWRRYLSATPFLARALRGRPRAALPGALNAVFA